MFEPGGGAFGYASLRMFHEHQNHSPGILAHRCFDNYEFRFTIEALSLQYMTSELHPMVVRQHFDFSFEARRRIPYSVFHGEMRGPAQCAVRRTVRDASCGVTNARFGVMHRVTILFCVYCTP